MRPHRKRLDPGQTRATAKGQRAHGAREAGVEGRDFAWQLIPPLVSHSSPADGDGGTPGVSKVQISHVRVHLRGRCPGLLLLRGPIADHCLLLLTSIKAATATAGPSFTPCHVTRAPPQAPPLNFELLLLYHSQSRRNRSSAYCSYTRPTDEPNMPTE